MPKNLTSRLIQNGIPGQELPPWTIQLRSVLDLKSDAEHMRLNRGLSDAGTIFFGSDYGGEDQHATFTTYTFLMASYESLSEWHKAILDIYRTQFNGCPRSMEYKKLRDKLRVKADP